MLNMSILHCLPLFPLAGICLLHMLYRSTHYSNSTRAMSSARNMCGRQETDKDVLNSTVVSFESSSCSINQLAKLNCTLQLQQLINSGCCVAHEATAAVAAAQEAARKQQESTLLQCNADWTARLGKVSFASVFMVIWVICGARSYCFHS